VHGGGNVVAVAPEVQPRWATADERWARTMVFLLQETQALPRVPDFAEGFLSGPRQRKSLRRAALGTAALTALHPLPRVGPSAGLDPRHNQVFAES
jgi:hypothetical protein